MFGKVTIYYVRYYYNTTVYSAGRVTYYTSVCVRVCARVYVCGKPGAPNGVGGKVGSPTYQLAN